jgi:hypothetical protein
MQGKYDEGNGDYGQDARRAYIDNRLKKTKSKLKA